MISKKYTIKTGITGLKVVVDSDAKYSSHEAVVKAIVWTLLDEGYGEVKVSQ